MSEPLTAARERLIAFADRIEAGESPNESAGYEWEALVEDIRALSLDAARTPAMPRHLFSGEPGGPCTDICLLADDDPIHRVLTNPVAPLAAALCHLCSEPITGRPDDPATHIGCCLAELASGCCHEPGD